MNTTIANPNPNPNHNRYTVVIAAPGYSGP